MARLSCAYPSAAPRTRAQRMRKRNTPARRRADIAKRKQTIRHSWFREFRFQKLKNEERDKKLWRQGARHNYRPGGERQQDWNRDSSRRRGNNSNNLG